MAAILPQETGKRTIAKIVNGRLMYEIVVDGQVATREAQGWALTQKFMSRKPGNRFKFDFDNKFLIV